MKTVSILGSTGSIGTQTLDIVRQSREEYKITALGGHSSVEALAEQAREFSPDMVVATDESAASRLKELLPSGVELHSGKNALAEVSPLADITVNAVVGFAGLPVTLEVLKAGKRLALANKESLIAAGPIVQKVRNTPGAELIPVDSEHCAIHQCLRTSESSESESSEDEFPVHNSAPCRVERIILTASGGPFRGFSKKELEKVSLKEALSHPTWDMGPKITVDSATLMNKGLEVIEANALFGISYDRIEVVIHPQSIIHSMVEFSDGATIAQLSMPDMRLCIGYSLAYPDRLKTPFGRINWQELKQLDFGSPDMDAFPALSLAFAAGRKGNTAPAVLSAANEVANSAFLEEIIPFNAIPQVVESVLECHGDVAADSLNTVIEQDCLARKTAQKLVQGWES